MPFSVMFHGERIGFYRADLVVDERIVVEVKAARTVEAAHLAQVRNYLCVSGLEVGLLLNFGQRPQFRRVIETRSRSRP